MALCKFARHISTNINQPWDNAHTINSKNCLLYRSSIMSQFLDFIHWMAFDFIFHCVTTSKCLALVVQRMDIYRINHYSPDSVVNFVNIYPVDSVIQPSNNRGQGRVVRKPVNVNPGLNVNWSITFSYLKRFSLLMFGVVWDYYSSKLKDKQYKQNTTPKSYKAGLAYRALNSPAQINKTGNTKLLKT